VTKTDSVKAFKDLNGITLNEYKKLSSDQKDKYYEGGTVKGERVFFPKRHGTYNSITKKEAELLELRVFTKSELAKEIQTSKRVLLTSTTECFNPIDLEGKRGPEIGILDSEKDELYFEIIYDYSAASTYIPKTDKFSVKVKDFRVAESLKKHLEGFENFEYVGCTWVETSGKMCLVFSVEKYIKENNFTFFSKNEILPHYSTELTSYIPELLPLGYALNFYRGELMTVFDLETFCKQKNLPLYKRFDSPPRHCFLTDDIKVDPSFYLSDEIGINITRSGQIKYVYSLETLCEKIGYEFLTSSEYQRKQCAPYFSDIFLISFPREWDIKQKAEICAFRDDGVKIFTFPGGLSSMFPVEKASVLDLVIPMRFLPKFQSFVREEYKGKIDFHVVKPYAITENNELLFNTKSNEFLQKVKLKVMFELFYQK